MTAVYGHAGVLGSTGTEYDEYPRTAGSHESVAFLESYVLQNCTKTPMDS